MKENDVVMIFGNPLKSMYPIDQAKLIEKVSELPLFEEWWVEYLNEPDHKYVALIKKDEQK